MSLIFNNEDTSLQAGNIKFHGANTPSSPITGDIWISDGRLYLRSNSSTWRLEQNNGLVQVEDDSSSSSSMDSSSSSSSISSESSSSSSSISSESSSSSSSSSYEAPLEAVVGTAVVGTNTVG